MAIVVEGTTSGGVGDAGGDTSTLTSWTPGSNELILLFVAMRHETITPTASGNGITFTQIHDIDNVQGSGGLTVLRGMSASPSSGSITVTHTSNALPVSCIAVRFSGVNTTGTNGSGAIGNTNSDTGPDPDDDDVMISVTVDDSDNFAVGSAWHRGQVIDDPPASGETTIIVNQLYGTGGSRTRCSVWYQTGATGSVQLGTTANLDADGDHVESAIEVKAASGVEYSQGAAGSQSSSGAIVGQGQKALSASQVNAGTIARLTSISQAASQASSGAVSAIKIVLKALAGNQTSSGAVSSRVNKVLAGIQATVGAITTYQPARAIINLALKARSASLTLAARSASLTLATRSTSFTLATRSTSFTLSTRSTSFTLQERT